jgi:hypothetical protein
MFQLIIQGGDVVTPSGVGAADASPSHTGSNEAGTLLIAG